MRNKIQLENYDAVTGLPDPIPHIQSPTKRAKTFRRYHWGATKTIDTPDDTVRGGHRKKNRKVWCKGRVGVHHVGKWKVDPRWSTGNFKRASQHEIMVCVNCEKHLDYRSRCNNCKKIVQPDGKWQWYRTCEKCWVQVPREGWCLRSTLRSTGK